MGSFAAMAAAKAKGAKSDAEELSISKTRKGEAPTVAKISALDLKTGPGSFHSNGSSSGREKECNG